MAHNSTAGAVESSGPSKLSEVVDSYLCKMDHVFYANALPSDAPRVTSVALEAIDILRDNGSGYHEGLHSYRHIRANPSDDILITFPLASHVRQSQGGRVAEFERGSFSILSTARPFRARMSLPEQQNKPRAIMARVSTAFLRQKFPRIAECYATPVKLRPGAGTIMRTLFDVALQDGQFLAMEQRRYLGRMLLDAIAESALEAPEFAALRLGPQRTTSKSLHEQARFFLLNNLGNADLCVDDVAGHCRISTRHLRNVFAEHEGQSVVSFLRESRLQRCRDELRNSTLADKLVANISMHWGFNDPAYFSRLYRNRFGKTPREERK